MLFDQVCRVLGTVGCVFLRPNTVQCLRPIFHHEQISRLFQKSKIRKYLLRSRARCLTSQNIQTHSILTFEIFLHER